MITKEQAELWKKWADVVAMCVGTNVDPKFCVRYKDTISISTFFNFNELIEDYQFALAVIEDKPVFVGDELYNLQGDKVIVNGISEDKSSLIGKSGYWKIQNLSWNPPKRTITINGKKFIAPAVDHTGYFISSKKLESFVWETEEACLAFEQELIKILSGNVD